MHGRRLGSATLTALRATYPAAFLALRYMVTFREKTFARIWRKSDMLWRNIDCASAGRKR